MQVHQNTQIFSLKAKEICIIKTLSNLFFFIYKDILTRIQKQIKKEFKWILIDFFLFLEGKKGFIFLQRFKYQVTGEKKN